MVKFKNSFRIALLKIGRLLVITLFYSYTKLIGILNVKLLLFYTFGNKTTQHR